ncbi:MAG: RtcB family protein, partial [Tannerella sp.]|nr:RtcB family protein [Tannerella sp.]
MQKVITTERLPIKMWLDVAEEEAIRQARNLANLPFAFRHISLMPDTHHGIGMPIGGVLATNGVIIPNAVGTDIGCGMCAIQTNVQTHAVSIEQLKAMIAGIREVIPVGFEHHSERQDDALMPQGFDLDDLHVVKNQYPAALKQIGTLGGGNHFIEIQKDANGFLWVMIHSGSRNLGKQVADYYNKKAKILNELWHVSVVKGVDLAFLPFKSDEARNYYTEMRYCIAFAFANRQVMMNRIQSVMTSLLPSVKFEPLINIAHNYAAWENHFGTKVVVHRKGATSARAGETGIIPGSQGTKSYIVEGLGNQESFMSCSHGAGRVMGRKQAIRTLNLATEQEILDSQGILHTVRSQSDLDESPSCYKDIETVMAFQRD